MQQLCKSNNPYCLYVANIIYSMFIYTTMHESDRSSFEISKSFINICNVKRLNVDKNISIEGFELEIKSLISQINQSISFESAGTCSYYLHPVRIG
jgi:hypothetical protein